MANTFPDKELSARAIKALMDARGLPQGPQRLDAQEGSPLRDAAYSYYQLFSAESAGLANHARS